jgi:hypothetical protein
LKEGAWIYLGLLLGYCGYLSPISAESWTSLSRKSLPSYYYNMDTLTRCEKVEEKSLKFLSNVNTIVRHMKQELVKKESKDKVSKKLKKALNLLNEVSQESHDIIDTLHDY